jgi:DNA-binding MarR family transcriptional regulator
MAEHAAHVAETAEQWSLPALLRAARSTYGRAIRGALEAAGCDDVPRNGLFAIGAIAGTGMQLSEIIGRLSLSKQAAGQLVDTLVVRGYLERSVDPEDRRRLLVHLTDRGQAAGVVIGSAVDRIEAALVARLGADHVRHTRVTLAALADGDGLDG